MILPVPLNDTNITCSDVPNNNRESIMKTKLVASVKCNNVLFKNHKSYPCEQTATYEGLPQTPYFEVLAKYHFLKLGWKLRPMLCPSCNSKERT